MVSFPLLNTSNSVVNILHLEMYTEHCLPSRVLRESPVNLLQTTVTARDWQKVYNISLSWLDPAGERGCRIVSNCVRTEVRQDKAGSCIPVNEEEFKLNCVKVD